MSPLNHNVGASLPPSVATHLADVEKRLKAIEADVKSKIPQVVADKIKTLEERVKKASVPKEVSDKTASGEVTLWR